MSLTLSRIIKALTDMADSNPEMLDKPFIILSSFQVHNEDKNIDSAMALDVLSIGISAYYQSKDEQEKKICPYMQVDSIPQIMRSLINKAMKVVDDD